MTAAERLSRVAMIPVAPVLYVQGKRLRRTTPILPDAALPWHGTEPGTLETDAVPLRLLVFGDSTSAGVGASTQHHGLPGNLARELSARWGRGVEWNAIGESGASAADLIDRYLSEAVQQEYDVVFLTVGANDALGLRSRRNFGRDIHLLLTALRAASPHAMILMSSLPAFFRFELLPNPLRYNLYLHSRSLESVARGIVAEFDNAWMSPPPPPYTAGFFASDLFHPSEQGYRDWARFAIDEAFASGALA
jgi:lysophospholipase L1-like esterase